MTETCSECPEGSPRPVKSRGLCEMHYVRHWRAGTLPPKRPVIPKSCMEKDQNGQPCPGKYKARGLCDTHYLRRYRGSTAEPQRAMSPEARFWFKVDKSAGPQGCWLWTAGHSGQGYGQFSVGGQKWLAHRYAYMLCVGPLSEYLQIDHVRARGCRSRLCVNPAHLEAVTLAENVRRAQVGHRAENGIKLKAFWAETAVPRFWAKADQSGGPLACWPWLGFIDSSGSGKAWWQRTTHMAREVAWLLSGETIPEGHTVSQGCARNDCINPAHLKTAPVEVEHARRTAVARAARGSSGAGTGRPGLRRRAGSKLTEEVVAECRRRYTAGETQDSLAAEFGVTTGAMHNAVRGVTWAGPVFGVLPVPRNLKPSQATDAFRERMARAGRQGAAARWHPGSSRV